MEHSDILSTHQAITVEIPRQLYSELLAKASETGLSESQLVLQGIQQILRSPNRELLERDRFVQIEAALEIKLKAYIDNLIKNQADISRTQASNDQPKATIAEPKKFMPVPTIRPLQIGDRVLVLEPDSPYYMAKLLVTKTSLIRATVETDTGEKTFLKRDLRFCETSLNPE
ncbi:hypothetical protein HCU40_06355 [Pseudanabaena biceps]|nr:hypothetical protein [Pseudanabaena biceps]